MLIFDQLKKNDPQLRLLTVVVLGGMFILLAGLWWMQIVSAGDYRANLETQSFRTVRTPAVRGKILDRNGLTLAENKPTYNVNLYLEDLREQFREEFRRLRPVRVITNSPPFWKRWLGFPAVRTEFVRLKTAQLEELQWQAQCRVVSNSLQLVSSRLQLPPGFDPMNLRRHYKRSLVLPYPVARDINPVQVARFEEQFSNPVGLDLEIQTTRVYPNQTAAAHLLGYLRYDDRSVEGEEAYFSYRLPDYSGVLGMEANCDKSLHGHAGAKSVLVNNLGYRQTENIWTPAEPGSNVVLTIDLPIQQAAEHALQNAPVNSPRGAAVVMDVNTGDVLALASTPTFNPNYFVDRQGFPADYYQRMQSAGAEHNRATGENYAPGSIFKTVVALACLERGLDPATTYEVKANPQDINHGVIYVGRRAIKDTAPPGIYDFEHALIHSSNSYFIFNGIPCLDKIVELGRQLHFGEPFRLGTRQETPGRFPDQQRTRSGWSDGDTANLCIGQGYIDVTPLQMTVLAAALANGGKVLWPRLVDRIESQDPVSTDPPFVFPKGRVRDQLNVRPRSLQIVRDAMLKDVESSDGTGTRAFIPGFRICAKTGTAQIENPRGEVIDHTTWFLSFAPYEKPRYAVVVMIESGISGGVTCAPVIRQIYLALLQNERNNANRTGTIARAN